MANFPTLKDVAKQYENLAKLNIQRGDTRAIKTGRLRDSIKVTTSQIGFKTQVMDLNTVYYGVFVNNGTVKMRSRPFATNAANSDVLKSMIDDYIKGVIQVEIFNKTKKKLDKIFKKSSNTTK
jgi:HK97 gp10 family phage protein